MNDPDRRERQYRAYIEALNERRLDDAQRYYADRVVYNGVEMTSDQWLRQAIVETLDVIPDFRWSIDRVVVEGLDIAARLIDSGVVTRQWRGVPVTGTPVHFDEHVFYRLSNDRVAEVWSMIDLEHLR
jgi:predicted ester cyclase